MEVIVRKLKSNLEVKYILDSREKDITLLKTLKLDKKFGSDNIKFIEIEQKCFKCESADVSTGDLGVEIRFEGDTEWRKTNLSIEYKRNSDIVSTLISNIKRFKAELLRAKDYGLEFWVVHNWNFYDVKQHIIDLQKKRILGYKSNPYMTFLNNYLELSKTTNFICCGKDFEETTRRICKNYIIKNKLHYK